MRPATTAFFVLTLAGLGGCDVEPSPQSSPATPASDVVTLTDENFEARVLKSREPVLVDFWAAWCRPCLDMKPAVRATAADLRGRAVVGEVDVDANAFTAQKYGIEALPVLVLFFNGEAVRRFEGPQSQETLTREIKGVLAARGEGEVR